MMKKSKKQGMSGVMKKRPMMEEKKMMHQMEMGEMMEGKSHAEYMKEYGGKKKKRGKK